jgi:Restriction endonuclease
MTNDDDIARATAHHPPADITPLEFEEFVVELLGATRDHVEGLTVRLHDKIQGVDGQYDFDATVRFRFGGMDFLVVVEAKRHKNPIKRELLQVLHDKMRSVGGQKAAMIATAPYQRGALVYAATHGIALATLTEGRFLFETRSALPEPTLTRDEARDRYGLPTFAVQTYKSNDTSRSIRVSTLSTDDPPGIVEALFGVKMS